MLNMYCTRELDKGQMRTKTKAEMCLLKGYFTSGKMVYLKSVIYVEEI